MDTKKYMSLERLQEYDALIKAKIDEGDAVFEDRIVATDEAELTTELPETFGGRTADEYALKSDLENVGSGGGVTSWNDLEDKPFDIETESTQVFRGNIEMALFMTDPTYVTSGKVSLEAGFITPDYYFMEIPDRVIITVGDVKTIVTVNKGGFEYEDKYVRVHKEQTGPGGNWTVLSFMCADTYDFVMEDVTVEIITYENITTIDPMYLPDDLGDKAFYEIRLVGQDYNTYRVYVNSSGQLVAEQV